MCGFFSVQINETGYTASGGTVLRGESVGSSGAGWPPRCPALDHCLTALSPADAVRAEETAGCEVALWQGSS